MESNFMNIYNRKLPELSEEQKKSPYAGFYYDPIEDPPEEILNCLTGQPMNPEFSLDFDDLVKVFLPDSLPADNGWCLRKDGTGYSVVRTFMPGITEQMEKWWYGWFPDPGYDYLNYKIWMPGWHESHGVPLIEDVGFGPMEIHSGGFMDHRILNLPKGPKELDPDYLHCVVSSGKCRPKKPAEGQAVGSGGKVMMEAQAQCRPVECAEQALPRGVAEGQALQKCSCESHPEEGWLYNTIVKCFKLYDGGMQTISLNYLGVNIEDGRFVKMNDVDPEKVRLFALHNAYECHRMGTLLPKLYKFANGQK